MRVSLKSAYSSLELPYGSEERIVSEKFREFLRKPLDNNSLKEVCAAYLRLTARDSSDEVFVDMNIVRELMSRFLSVPNSDDESDLNSDEEIYPPNEKYKAAQAKKREELADKLISEEEKEKRKAEKKREKKKKRKEKKRLEKEKDCEATTNGGSVDSKSDQNGVRSSDEGEGIDPDAAFVKKSKKKMPEQNNIPKTDTRGAESTSVTSSERSNNDTSKAVINIAIKGNQNAQAGDYPAAIKCFSEAIKLNPTDYRFFGNRSYCYDRTMQFDKALLDAEKCIELSPDWAKGHFRKGRALAGLKLFSDAEKAFVQVLKLDKNCEEAQKELVRVRTQQLIDMGFAPKLAENAVLNSSSLQQALDSLLTGVAGPSMTVSSADDEIYYSDEDYDEGTGSDAYNAMTNGHGSRSAISIPNTAAAIKTKAKMSPSHVEHLTEEKKMDPTNPHGLTALWVGNVLPSVSDADLQKLFSRYGVVSSVRCLPDKYCAFINFKSKEAAGKAMNALQDHEIQGQHLLIKFPDNPIAAASGSAGSVTTKLKQTVAASTAPLVAAATHTNNKKQNVSPRASEPLGQKPKGPVNGDECYFWRTTGCQFGEKCRYKHVKDHKGVDKKPWQRVK